MIKADERTVIRISPIKAVTAGIIKKTMHGENPLSQSFFDGIYGKFVAAGIVDLYGVGSCKIDLWEIAT